MENKESVYLYSEKYSPLYSKVLEDLEVRTCPHTHTVYALMDVEEADVPQNMVDHVSTCKECQQTVMLSQSVNNRINSLIPDFLNSTPVVLEKNNKDMFFRNEFAWPARTQRGIQRFLNGAAENILDILSVIFSVKMGLTYVAGILLALFLNWAFN